MNALDQPATEQQLRYLEEHGQVLEHQLTRAEAAALIRQIREHPVGYMEPGAKEIDEQARREAFGLRVALEEAKRGAGETLAGAEIMASAVAQAMGRRLEFWLDTCREVTEIHHMASTQVFKFYQTHGCRFSQPAREQVQEVLDALDAAMPTWEKDHPELFYQTLELNFPQLLKHL